MISFLTYRRFFENTAILDKIRRFRIQFISRRQPVTIVLSFAMNFLRALFGVLSILLLPQNISGGEYKVIRNNSSGPLALIQEGKTLRLAIPEKVEGHKAIAKYTVDENGEPGLTPQFKTACAKYDEQHKAMGDKWRKNSFLMDEESELYYLQQYTDEKMKCEASKYRRRPGPSIKKTNRDCANSEGEIYEVGYPVTSSEEELEIQFMAIYEICYSKEETSRTIYTNHRIHSPSLLLLKIRETYTPTVKDTFVSHLDAKARGQDYWGKYIYQYVPRYDMPTVLWGNTTLFPFNYIPINMNRNIFRGMSKYDNVVRLFSKKANKQLRIYSGMHVTEPKYLTRFCFLTTCVTRPTNSLWRVIFDDENNATILVTQYTERKCEETSYVCDQNRIILQHYNGGGCTYTCSVSRELLDSLHLPELTIGGSLKIEYKTEEKIDTQLGVGDDDAAEPNEFYVDIADFSIEANFVAALIIVDGMTAFNMQSEGAMGADGNADGGTDAGGDHDGDVDGDGGAGHGNGGGWGHGTDGGGGHGNGGGGDGGDGGGG